MTRWSAAKVAWTTEWITVDPATATGVSVTLPKPMMATWGGMIGDRQVLAESRLQGRRVRFGVVVGFRWHCSCRLYCFCQGAQRVLAEEHGEVPEPRLAFLHYR